MLDIHHGLELHLQQVKQGLVILIEGWQIFVIFVIIDVKNALIDIILIVKNVHTDIIYGIEILDVNIGVQIKEQDKDQL